MEFFTDAEPRPASVNMAMDEILLEEISVPVLRVYRWLQPSVSFGYFEKYSGIENQHPGRELVRRWTGGGVVLHGEDFTYSLIIPRDYPLGKMRPAQSYLAIHELITQTMQESGISASLTAGSQPKISTSCFENAVRHDVLLGSRKIAGAAQRRTLHGLLHQGSIQSMEVPDDFAEKFAAKLAAKVMQRPLKQSELSAAIGLAESKYATPQWMRKF
jgi:lipoate-protein ligase A